MLICQQFDSYTIFGNVVTDSFLETLQNELYLLPQFTCPSHGCYIASRRIMTGSVIVIARREKVSPKIFSILPNHWLLIILLHKKWVYKLFSN